MSNFLWFSTLLLGLGFLAEGVLAQPAPEQTVIPNWPAPAFWQPSARGDSQDIPAGRAHAVPQAALSSPLPFIAVDPCRQYDSRNFTPLLDNTSRAVTLIGAPCGISSNAQAVSVNITVFNITGAPSNGVFRVGIVSPPPTAWINFPPTETQRANAGIVATNGSGQMIVQVNMGAGQVDFTCDVNGYFAGAGAGSFNTFLGLQAGNFTMTGDRNTGIGLQALFNNTSGSFNAAMGHGALQNNTTGDQNTAIGYRALVSNNSGDSNTATGYQTLFSNTLGTNNTAIGYQALLSNTTGNFNTAVGVAAGSNLTTGDFNICIGAGGVAGDINTIRIGSGQVLTFVAGISGQSSSGGVAVYVNSSGKLGTTTSSRRFKEDIREIGEESDGLMRLRPVAFKYRQELDPTGLTQYGLIAEEVAEVYPELVASDRGGRPETVRYHLLVPMLLNEVQKDRKTITDLKARLERLEALMSESVR